jgi:hypothetical protein
MQRKSRINARACLIFKLHLFLGRFSQPGCNLSPVFAALIGIFPTFVLYTRSGMLQFGYTSVEFGTYIFARGEKLSSDRDALQRAITPEISCHN